MTEASEVEVDPYRGAVAYSLALVDELQINGSERDLVLGIVLKARLDGLGLQPRRGGDRSTGGTSSLPGAGTVADGVGEPAVARDLDPICARLGISYDEAELVFALTDAGLPELVVSGKRIKGNKASMTKTIVKLVAAARQSLGIEEWTTASTVRDVVRDFGALDPSNYSTHFGQVDDVAVIRGSGQSKAIKITKPGYEAIGDFVKSIVREAE